LLRPSGSGQAEGVQFRPRVQLFKALAVHFCPSESDLVAPLIRPRRPPRAGFGKAPRERVEDALRPLLHITMLFLGAPRNAMLIPRIATAKARSKSNQIQPNRAKPAHRRSKKTARFSLDFPCPFRAISMTCADSRALKIFFGSSLLVKKHRAATAYAPTRARAAGRSSLAPGRPMWLRSLRARIIVMFSTFVKIFFEFSRLHTEKFEQVHGGRPFDQVTLKRQLDHGPSHSRRAALLPADRPEGP
jgi:hypothetical protein